MPIIRFAEWIPDAAPLGSPGAPRVINAYPGTNSYKPVGRLAVLSTALDARPRGAISARDKTGVVYSYAGDAAKLYRLVSTTWTDSSKAGGYSTATSESWEFVRWKNKILATNYTDDPQQITMGGSIFSDLTTDFKARHIAVIGNFIVFGNTTDSTDGAVPDRIRWSAFNDETDYTVSASTLSDFRDLNVGGEIYKIIGGETGIIVSERSTFRMSFVGAPVVFQIDEILPGVGTIASGAVASLGDTTYFISQQGFVAVTGSTARYIGAGRVDQFILEDIDQSQMSRITSAVDPRTARIAWAYPGPGNLSGRPNRIIIYDTKLDRWTLIEQETDLLWRAYGISFTLEDLDSLVLIGDRFFVASMLVDDYFAENYFSIGSASLESLDDLITSLDSNSLKGESSQLAAFDENFRHGFFAGSPMTAEIDTGDIEIYTGHRTQLNAFRPLVNGGTVQARVGTRDRQSDSVTYTTTLSQRSTGRFTCRENARYHRLRAIISGDWEDAIGVQIEPTEARRAGMRG